MPKRLNRRYTLEERMVMVETALSIMAQHGIKPEASAYTIAKKLDMYPGQRVYAILSEMVARGRLTVRDVQHRPNVEKTLYSLPEGSYKMPEVQDAIIKINGVEYVKERLF